MALRVGILAALCVSANAFAPSSSALPSLRRGGAQCSYIVMKSEEDLAANNLAKRRMVVGGLFAGALSLAGLPENAEAAKSGGRMGGGSFRPKAAPTGGGRAAARAPPAPTVISRPSVTIIQAAPSIPYGYGGGFGSPFGFGSAPVFSIVLLVEESYRAKVLCIRTVSCNSMAVSCVFPFSDSHACGLICRWRLWLRLVACSVHWTFGD